MSAFGDVALAYERIAGTSIYDVPVTPGEIGTVSACLASLRKLRVTDDTLDDAVRTLHYIQYRLAVNLLPANDPALGLDVLRQQLAAHADELNAGTVARTTIDAALCALEALCQQASTPLCEEAVEILGTAGPGERLVVLAHARNCTATAQVLAAAGAPTEVTSRTQLRTHPLVETILCVGPHQLFQSAVWNASRADSVCFVHYPLGVASLPSGGLFGEDGGLRTPRFRVSRDIAPVDNIEFAAPEHTVFQEAGRKLASAHRAASDTDQEDAQLLLLEGGYAVWMNAGEGDWMWAIDFIDDEPRVLQISAADMSAGMFVLFRDQGATSDLVRVVADRDCDAARHRPAQDRWKRALSTAIVRAGGAAGAARLIRQLGAATVNPAAWVGPRSIRPHRKSDFSAACRFAGIEDEVESIWASLSAIKRAHLKAGRLIRKQLEDELIDDGGARLQENGRFHLHSAALGGLSAYRVVFKHPDRQRVDSSRIDKPFLVEELGWLV